MGASRIIFALQVVGYIAFLPGTWQLGNLFCRLFLRMSGSGPTAQKQPHIGVKAGRYIGLLERLLIVIGLVMGNWEVIIAVVAIKTVARYRELDDQVTAEYFLIGSLASILWALVIAGGLVAYDITLGLGWIEMLRSSDGLASVPLTPPPLPTAINPP